MIIVLATYLVVLPSGAFMHMPLIQTPCILYIQRRTKKDLPVYLRPRLQQPQSRGTSPENDSSSLDAQASGSVASGARSL